MSANTSPIFTGAPDVQWAAAITVANTAKDGTGTVVTVFTADATNGGYIKKLRIKPLGTNIATVLRVFINNGLTNATAANNAYFGDYSLSATTNSESAAIGGIDIPMEMALPPGYKINIVLGTAIAGGVQVIAIGGKY